MVQKFQSPVRVYKYPFELVMAAYERRFPKCPQMPIVLDCIVVTDETLDNGARHNTTRRCKLAVDAPYLFKKIIGIDVCFFVQQNFLDRRARTLTIEATNETFSSRIEIFERCRYYTHPDNPEWTCFDQTATLDIKNFFGFEHSMEKMGMKQYTQTTLKGKEIIEYFIEELKNEGVTHVERWTGPEPEEEPTSPEAKVSVTSDQSRPISPKEEITIDGEYISSHLGHLSPMQESKILETQKFIASQNVTNPPDYPTILRFLRARDFSVEKASQMLLDSLEWREQIRADHFLEEYKTPAVVQKYFPGDWHKHDNEGRPVFVLRLGHMDVKGILKAIGEDGLLKLTISICENGLKLINEATKTQEKPIIDWCLLIDLEGLSMRHLWRPGIKALLKVIETVEKNYPETLGRVLIVRAPRVFPIAWTIVSAFIDERTRSKFLLYGGPECLHMQDGLEHYIEANDIPDFLGGTCKTLIHENGLVPKTLYRTFSQEGDGEHHPQGQHHGLYSTVDISGGQTYEVVVKNDDPKSVLTWDFDVLKNDLHFTVYKTSIPITITDPYVSIFDLSNFVEGKHFSRVEPTLVCRHKESVQGSHVMASTENYVMQWYSPPSVKDGSKLAFFHEILSSANYKGSMSSLQSGHSSASEASSCQSR